MDPHRSQAAADEAALQKARSAFTQVIDVDLLAPRLTEDYVREGIGHAIRLEAGSVFVRPCDVDLAARALSGTSVKLGSVCGYPFGGATTGAKVFEARDLLRRGVKDLEAVIAPSKLIARQFPYLETELLQIAEACGQNGAVLKIAVDMGALAEDTRAIAVRLAKRVGAQFISTGMELGVAVDSAALTAAFFYHSRDDIQVKCGCGVQTLATARAAISAGAARIGTTKLLDLVFEFETDFRATASDGPAA